MANNTKKINNEMEQTFDAVQGIVIGRTSDGVLLTQKARVFNANSEKELIKKIKNAFNKGVLDNHFIITNVFAVGYEVTVTSMMTVEGKTFTNIDRCAKKLIFGDKDLFEDFVSDEMIGDEHPEVEAEYIEC